jgi:hypothetical protein
VEINIALSLFLPYVTAKAVVTWFEFETLHLTWMDRASLASPVEFGSISKRIAVWSVLIKIVVGLYNSWWPLRHKYKNRVLGKPVELGTMQNIIDWKNLDYNGFLSLMPDEEASF